MSAELFGLAGSLPRPAWVVLDAARDHRFTGELAFETLPEVRVYLDRGRIYLAERVTDPSLGTRLVDAGALNAAQLEHGSMRLGGAEYLGRLFERVPSIDRHAVLVTTELMTEECVGWLAGQHIGAVESIPYRHHECGIHRWEAPDDAVELVPGSPLPAPAPDEAPVEIAPPEPLFTPSDEIAPFEDDMLRWDQPSWLDELPGSPFGSSAPSGDGSAPPSRSEQRPFGQVSDPSFDSHVENALSIRSDWVEGLDADGFPQPGSDPLTPVTRVPPLTTEPLDRFEVIWPSGEVDEQFGGTDVASHEGHHPDLDRAGPTARLVRDVAPATPAPMSVDVAWNDVDEVADTGRGDLVPPAGVAGHVGDVNATGAGDDVIDDVVLAVRRAVASLSTDSLDTDSLDTDSLDTRRRATGRDPDVDTSRGVDIVPPGRVAVRDEPSDWAATGHADVAVQAPARSVFDDLPGAAGTSDVADRDTDSDADSGAGTDDVGGPTRTGALRRLIGSLRRR